MSFDYLAETISQLEAKISHNTKLLEDPELKDLASEEIKSLQAQLDALQSGSNNTEDTTETTQLINEAPVIIEIRAAAGGDEASLFAADLARMYTRFAENTDLKCEILDESTLKISKSKSNPWAFGAFQTFKDEAGVHRVQRVPSTESAGRIHTSTATVAVLPVLPPKAVEIKESDLEWQFTRAGGPGGQNVNKVSSAVRLTHKPTCLITFVRVERTQERNKQIALEMLRSKLWELQEEERLKTMEDSRQAIGRGMRSEKIKTYNFPQNRLTDHRLGKSWYSLKEVMEGDLADVLTYTIENIAILPPL